MSARASFELGWGAEGVSGARDEQAGQVETPEVVGAHVVGPAGRVERVADEHEAGGWETFGDGHAAHAPSHGTPSQEDPLRCQRSPGSERGSLFHHRSDQDRRTVRSSPAGQGVGEVHSPDCRGPPWWQPGRQLRERIGCYWRSLLGRAAGRSGPNGQTISWSISARRADSRETSSLRAPLSRAPTTTWPWLRTRHQ